MDDARKLLDSLMGPSRDKGQEEQQKADGWKDRNVCKRFLVGFCPNDAQDNWFKNTRRDTGTCNKIHSERLKELFENHADRQKYESEYEKDFLTYLEGLVHEADAWIAREKKNCRPAGKETKIPPSVKENMANMQEQLDDLMKKAEDLAEAGDFAASKEAVATAKKLREDVEQQREKYTFNMGGEEVCEVCGVRCQPDGPDTPVTPGAGGGGHYQAHFEGKLHESYVRVRQKVKELREKQKNSAPRRREKEDAEAGRSNSGDRRRRRDRGSRERGDRREHKERRSRSRKKENSKERRSRSRKKDRGRG